MQNVNPKKVIFFIVPIIVISLFLITSCSTTQIGSKIGLNTNTQTLDQSLRTGTEGVTLAFQTNMPPPKIYQGEDFSLGVLVANKGASDIRDLQFIIGGYDTTFLDVQFKQLATSFGTQIGPADLPNAAKIHTLRGKSISYPVGAQELVAFTVSPHQSSTNPAPLPPGDTYNPRFTATACYQYSTNFGTSVCIDPFYKDPLYVGPTCGMSAQSFSGGQGAPVTVTKVEPILYLTGEKKILQYKIYFSNVGGGELFDNLAWTFNCNPQGAAQTKTLQTVINVLTIKAKLGATDLICYAPYGTSKGATNTVALQLGKNKNGEGDFVICTADISAVKASYTSALSVNAIYGYSQKVTATTSIKRSIDYVSTAPIVDMPGASSVAGSGSSPSTG